jgi:hypothetical protein
LRRDERQKHKDDGCPSSCYVHPFLIPIHPQGAIVKVPLMLAPGMGLNAYFATVASATSGFLTYQQAMAAVLLSGLIYLVLTW